MLSAAVAAAGCGSGTSKAHGDGGHDSGTDSSFVTGTGMTTTPWSIEMYTGAVNATTDQRVTGGRSIEARAARGGPVPLGCSSRAIAPPARRQPTVASRAPPHEGEDLSPAQRGKRLARAERDVHGPPRAVSCARPMRRARPLRDAPAPRPRPPAAPSNNVPQLELDLSSPKHRDPFSGSRAERCLGLEETLLIQDYRYSPPRDPATRGKRVLNEQSFSWKARAASSGFSISARRVPGKADREDVTNRESDA
jgi:hypothetical protein